ncbi:hypothetical protein V1478_017868, partial [Vespula squamosa]
FILRDRIHIPQRDVHRRGKTNGLVTAATLRFKTGLIVGFPDEKKKKRRRRKRRRPKKKMAYIECRLIPATSATAATASRCIDVANVLSFPRLHPSYFGDSSSLFGFQWSSRNRRSFESFERFAPYRRTFTNTEEAASLLFAGNVHRSIQVCVDSCILYTQSEFLTRR